MAGDLGGDRGEVHARAAEVLHFWFDELRPDQWWEKDAALDRRIAERFGSLRDDLLARGAAGWRDDADTVLAAVIVLDQFSRNIHRESAEAFAADPLALALARDAIAAGLDARIDRARRGFLYMPFMHAEDHATQDESVRLFEALGDAVQLSYACDHRDVIVRFGRFPHRNAVLGRASTAAEAAYLSQPGAGY